MEAEKRILFACARQDFESEHELVVRDAARRHEIDWELVWSVARSQGLAPLVYTNLKRCTPTALGMPAPIEQKFNQYLWQNMVRRENTARKVGDILAFCNQRSAEVMVIKGAALNIQVYEQPWYTFSEDVDLVVRPGCTDRNEADNAEIVSFLEEVNLERGSLQEHIEYEFFEHHDVTMNGILPVDFREIRREAVPIRFRGHDALVMSPENMLISACISSSRKRFFRLKSLCDIRELVDCHQDLDWQGMIRRAQAYRCHNIVYTAMLVVDLTLGCRLPNGVLDSLGVHPFRAGVITCLASILCRSASLASLSHGEDQGEPGEKWSLPLLLTYATYSWDQTRGKVKRVLEARQGS
jgi:hypothetical protein